jgi:hypothetical protein
MSGPHKAPVDIPKAEKGVIRVFAISRPLADMARALKQTPKDMLASGLLNHIVGEDDFELFALSDLAGVGLSRYLGDGYDVDKAAIHKDHARLEALDGYVLLLFSRVSDQGDVRLTPAADLTLIGTYAGPVAVYKAEQVPSEAAQLYSGAKKAPTSAGRSRVGSVLTGVMGLLALLILWWILR